MDFSVAVMVRFDDPILVLVHGNIISHFPKVGLGLILDLGEASFATCGPQRMETPERVSTFSHIPADDDELHGSFQSAVAVRASHFWINKETQFHPSATKGRNVVDY